MKYYGSALFLLGTASVAVHCLATDIKSTEDAMAFGRDIVERRLHASYWLMKGADELLRLRELTYDQEVTLLNILATLGQSSRESNPHLLIQHIAYRPKLVVPGRAPLDAWRRYPVVAALVNIGTPAKGSIVQEILATDDPEQLRLLFMTLAAIVEKEIRLDGTEDDPVQTHQFVAEQLKRVSVERTEEQRRQRLQRAITYFSSAKTYGQPIE